MDNLRDLESMHIALKEFRQISKANRVILLAMLNKEHEEIGDKIDDPCAELKREYLAAGGRHGRAGIIPAIKRARELTGLGLKEAKDLVESWG